MNYLFYLIIFLFFYIIIKRRYLFKFKNLLYPFIFIVLIILTVLYPKNSIDAALRGIDVWFFTVLPSLLPFFIISEITIQLGFVNFIGTLISPLMRPLFNIPGEGAFVFAMSVTSGYPVGAKLISKLRLENKISQVEAQRLASFASTSGPLFIIGAVSIGMFNNERLGFLLILSHYLGSITLGLIFRFFKYNVKSCQISMNYKKNLKDSYNNLLKNKSIGNIMSDAMQDAMNTILIIGGFIIFYSVVIESLNSLNIVYYIMKSFENIGVFIEEDIIKGFLFGIIEITNGTKILSQSIESNSLHIYVLVSILIGWSGISIHSQALSFFSKIDINNRIYLFSKLMHGLFAGAFTIILYKPLMIKSISVFNYSSKIKNSSNYFGNFFDHIYISFKIILFILFLLTISSLISSILYNIYKVILKGPK
ncbi:sporulation integral membrane protein YlbJ [Senegalia massiliensis]|uniref:Sporulation integral membrane protein YlbJ n=1 Tax=Senegalia massiliensis TaxID=1720316 RepID=A0A845QYK3_9CLOT|nr:sporulation integral membrane protein YlbJ [Senegalia massiliensis]NBI06869.1 sporulation integral membrane protein YlbJ [Senegalia massiliensis]